MSVECRWALKLGVCSKCSRVLAWREFNEWHRGMKDPFRRSSIDEWLE